MTDSPIGDLEFDGGVLWHRIRPQTVVRDHHVEGVWDAIRSLVGDRRYAAVVDVRGVSYASRQVRDAFSTTPEDVNEAATALVVDAVYTSLLGSLFLKLSRPKRPVKMFTDEVQAAEWARTQL